MKIYSISDLHIKEVNDDGYQILEKFFQLADEGNADVIFLLGDIFDLMVGPHTPYYKKFYSFFMLCAEWIHKGKKLYFFEGNHDVHVRHLFYQAFYERKILDQSQFFISQKPMEIELDGISMRVSHGDEYDYKNEGYQKYKQFIHKPIMRFIGERIMPFAIIDYLGRRASKISRKAGQKSFNAETVRIKIREGVEKVLTRSYRYIIGGHTHVLDVYSSSHGIYLNNGYPIHDRKFLIIEDNNYKFESI